MNAPGMQQSNNSDMALDNDTNFSMHAQTYKTIVTHYFACKLEIWYTLVLKPLLGIDLCTLVHEFQTARGAIHSHVLAYSEDQPWNEDIKRALHDYALRLHSLLQDLDAYIKTTASEEQICSMELNKPHKGMARRERYLKGTHEGRERFKIFGDSVQIARIELEDTICNVLETNFGYNAIHHGILPTQWVKPGGRPRDGYRSQTTGMASSKDVLETKELKQMKFQREDDLLNRRVNITNHCGTHKCSEYCLKTTVVNELYDENKHSEEQRKSSFKNDLGQEIVPVRIQSCRMHFGIPLRQDYSGENNITGGIPFNNKGKIEFDRNQLPKYVARRNHPRIIDEPSLSLYFGANNDIQPLLINSSYQRLMELFDNDQNEYEKFFNNMAIMQQSGLEHFNASHIINQYLTSYQCKGGKSTDEWKRKIEQITEAFCSDENNGNKSLRSLIGKHMHSIPKGISVTRDQSQYMLGGGILKRTTYGSIRKCSVSSTYWDDMVSCGADGHNDADGKRFVWTKILQLYKQRTSELHNVSLYHFCCCHWPLEKKEKPVQFFGFHNSPSWPLEESYSKWILTIYYPWTNSPEEHMQPTYAMFLSKNYNSDHIPSHVRAAISRARYNMGDVEVSESNGFRQDGRHLTPTIGRSDDRLMDSADANNFHYGNYANGIEGELEGMSEDDYDRLPPPDVTFQWDKRQYGDTDHYNHERALDWLLNAREVFYQNRCSHMLGGIPDEELELFDEEIFRPENAKGSKQRMIVFMLLYQHYQFHNWKTQVSHLGTSTTAEPTDTPPPPSIFLLVEGKPGSGKSFILKTLRNITRAIMKSNLAELTSAPTGVAGSLINASTHCRVASIPTGKAVTKPPSKIAATNYQQVLSLAKSHQSIFSRFMDEHSMMGRKQFAWMKHRMEEFRRPFPLVDNNGQEVLYESDHPLEKSLYDRPFGGIPFIMSCGDFAQLPAVMDKMLFDNASATPNTADSCGKVAFAEFINSPDNESAISSVVIMDEVVRQEDRRFKLFLDNVANGSLDLDDVGLIRSRCLQCLSEEEKLEFQNAIHLVPTWAEASSIVFNYLSNLGNPIAKWKATYSTTRRDRKNCCLKEKSYPSRVAMCTGAVVMLLKNFIVEEWKILNGSIGTVVDIIYANPLGPREENATPLYVVVDFRQCSVPDDQKCFDDCPSTFVSIPVITERCEKGCCSISTIPLRVCIAITTYKGQGITVGIGETFERIVIHLPLDSKFSVTGQELVQFSRAKDLRYIAIGNDLDELVTEKLLKIGKNKGNDKRKEFVEYLKSKQEATLSYYQEEIKKIGCDNGYGGTYDDGCDFLLHWYRTNFFHN